jgi:hypothetical protein
MSNTVPLQLHLPEPLALFVAQMSGDGGRYDSPEAFIGDLLKREMRHQPLPIKNEAAAWERKLRNWAASHTGLNLPHLSDADISRDSMYPDR